MEIEILRTYKEKATYGQAKAVADSYCSRDQSKKAITSKKFYNTWRAIRYTLKGKKVGHQESWSEFINFYNDMHPSYIEGHLIARRDKTLPFTRDNCFWIERSLHRLTRPLIKLTFNEEELSLKEWSVKLGISLLGLQQRYHMGKGYSVEEILFGKKREKRKILPENEIRVRASKLVATYKVKDNKRGYDNDLDKPWFIENILLKPCKYCGGYDRIGADRTNNSIGHIKNNIVPCCHSCNVMRGDRFTPEEMVLIGAVVNKIYKQRNDTNRGC